MSCCRSSPAVHAAVFIVLLAAWTIALLSPVPKKSAQDVLGSEFGLWVFGKTLHVGVYAFLAALGGTAHAFGRKWILVLPALVVHGGLTEFVQQFVGRGMRLEDLGLDTLGIAIGGFVACGVRTVNRGRSGEAASTPE